MLKPTVPLWCTVPPVAGDRVEPQLAKKQTGWVKGEEPPHEFMNWIHYQTYQWLLWIDTVLMPVGSVKIFDDFNGLTAFPDTDAWYPYNGTVIVDANSIYNGLTIRDMSGRYPCGFGNDGAGTINNAGALGIVGNAGHTVNLQHQHGGSSASTTTTTNTTTTTTINSVTVNNFNGNTGNADITHLHNPGSLQFNTMEWARQAGDGGIQHYYGYDSGGATNELTQQGTAPGGGFIPAVWKTQGANTTGTFYTSNPTGTTANNSIPHVHDASHGHTASGTATSASTSTSVSTTTLAIANDLSTTQSIRPRSQQFRFYLRYK